MSDWREGDTVRPEPDDGRRWTLDPAGPSGRGCRGGVLVADQLTRFAPRDRVVATFETSEFPAGAWDAVFDALAEAAIDLGLTVGASIDAPPDRDDARAAALVEQNTQLRQLVGRALTLLGDIGWSARLGDLAEVDRRQQEAFAEVYRRLDELESSTPDPRESEADR